MNHLKNDHGVTKVSMSLELPSPSGEEHMFDAVFNVSYSYSAVPASRAEPSDLDITITDVEVVQPHVPYWANLAKKAFFRFLRDDDSVHNQIAQEIADETSSDSYSDPYYDYS